MGGGGGSGAGNGSVGELAVVVVMPQHPLL